ncbi:hypothetical protein [Pseudomonas sp. C5pp]|uniref:hypothetical protein n=1 Tax=Pseudomonas sp. C5pp TaxID=1586081 RepID=UPI00057C42E9|nr:hypothetical protein [Pseudomonas sp. C5pp]KIC80497.1 hypothetical protein RR51_21600 [Pseudomonas sp. C5pp]
MRQRYHYLIEIDLKNSEKPETLFSGFIDYSGGGSYQDQLVITNRKISINCTRASKIDLNGVFNNYQSALYGQITKAIFFYICRKTTIPELTSITISTQYRDRPAGVKKIEDTDFKSHAKLTSGFLSGFKIDRLEAILAESEKGAGLLKAVSHLTRSKTKHDIYDRFDSLWKSFNALYRTIAKKSTELECQQTTRSLLLDHARASESSRTLLGNITADELRKKLRWRQLILNDYEHDGKAGAFKDFVLRYTDARLMQVFKETLSYRKDSLTKAQHIGAVEAHIEKHLKAGLSKNQEVIAILCIKYAYFVRNKSAHGERLDRIIGLSNKEVIEVKWLSDLLECLIIDLINANDLY